MPAEDDASTWTQPEMVRAFGRMELAFKELQKSLTSDYVRRDVYEADQRGLDEWKRDAATDIVNLEAEAARSKRDTAAEVKAVREDHDKDITAIRTGQRWALGVAVSGVGVMIGMLAWVVDNVGLGAS